MRTPRSSVGVLIISLDISSSAIGIAWGKGGKPKSIAIKRPKKLPQDWEDLWKDAIHSMESDVTGFIRTVICYSSQVVIGAERFISIGHRATVGAYCRAILDYTINQQFKIKIADFHMATARRLILGEANKTGPKVKKVKGEPKVKKSTKITAKKVKARLVQLGWADERTSLDETDAMAIYNLMLLKLKIGKPIVNA